MQLQDFFDYKNKLMEDLLTSQEVVSLLNEKILMQNADELAYKQVFPYEYIPETVQEGKTAPVQPSKPVVIYYPPQTRSYYIYHPFTW